MRNFKFFLLLFTIILWGVALPSQDAGLPAEEPTGLSLFEFFHRQEDSLPLLRLDTDWKMLVRKKMKEEYQPAILSFRHADGSSVEMEVKVRARGNVRKEICYFPPIKIKIRKKQLKELGFKQANDLKLVLPCKEGSRYEESMVREALAYRLYEIVHPIHVKTKIIRLEGLENGEPGRFFHAFLVEDEEELSARLDAKVIEQGVVRSSVLDRDSYLKMCFFQYMIANVDWSVANKHNLELLAVPGFERMVVIPYDFDYAGFVGNYYAVPAPSLPIEDVNERYFLGHKVTEEEAISTARFFLSKKEEIIQQCLAAELLDEKRVAAACRYLTKFFDLLEDEKAVVRTFVNDY